MRVNTTITIDLPVDLEQMILQIEEITEPLTKRKVWRSASWDVSQRDGTPAQVSVTISGETRE